MELPAATDCEYTPRQLERARDVARRAERWREDNPQAWRHLTDLALAWAAEGRRVSGRALVEAVRRRDFADAHGRPTRTNNDYAPVLVRWLAREHPEVAPYVERRTTVYDRLLGGGCRG